MEIKWLAIVGCVVMASLCALAAVSSYSKDSVSVARYQAITACYKTGSNNCNLIP